MIAKSFTNFSSQTTLAQTFSQQALPGLFAAQKQALETSLADGTWKTLFPGKIVFGKFCGDFLKEDAVRVRQVYVDFALREKHNAIQDIIDIFDHFRVLSN